MISVRGRDSTYDFAKWNDIDKLKDKMKQDNGELVSFQLVDDFAESHIYKRVMTILSELELEIGLKYTKE